MTGFLSMPQNVRHFLTTQWKGIFSIETFFRLLISLVDRYHHFEREYNRTEEMNDTPVAQEVFFYDSFSYDF